ncbi:MAG: translation initiation factor IF-3 [Patescibacteria group bacterium UBA2163]
MAIRTKKKNRKLVKREERIRINGQIRVPEVRVVTEDGDNLGVMQTEEAIVKAQEAGLDLIEVSPKAKPPIAKIADYGKFQYDLQKKASAAKQKAHTTETKSIQVEVVTGEHDLIRKARQTASWLREGHRVKIELFLKGRYKYMESAFLKERLNRFVLSVPEEYKIAEDVKKGPKGFYIILERASKKAADKDKKEPAQKKEGAEDLVKESTSSESDGSSESQK